MTDTPRTDEVAEYEAAVRRHLADLPAAAREDLLADLETHLTEVAADLEPGASLADRLGSAEAYARELREAAELPAASEKVSGFKGLAEGYTRSAGVGEAGEFWKSLQPGWWVLRGVLVAGLLFVAVVWLVLGLLFTSVYEYLVVVVPSMTVLTLACVWFSLRLGARSRDWGSGGRLGLLAVGNGALAVVALLIGGAGLLSGYVPDDSYEGTYGETASEYATSESIESSTMHEDPTTEEADTPSESAVEESSEPTATPDPTPTG